MYEPEVDLFVLDPAKPLVLLLGHLEHEGILSTLHTAGMQYKRKMLESKPENWQDICGYFGQFQIKAVLLKLNRPSVNLLTQKSYWKVRDELLAKVGSVPALAFIYQGLLTGEALGLSETPIPQDVRMDVMALFERHGIPLLPYRRNAEVTLAAQAFLDDQAQNLLLRLYVPTGQMWAGEVDHLLQLFQTFLSRVCGISVRLDRIRTRRGTVFQFYGDEPETKEQLQRHYSEFVQFVDLCMTDQKAAEAILLGRNINPSDILDIITRFAKEARRVLVDLRQERERKLLAIRHRLESELVDVLPSTADWSVIDSLVASVVPRVGAPANIALPPAPIVSQGDVVVNLRPQVIEKVYGVVAQELRGDQDLGQDARALLELIAQYGGDQTNELTASLYEVEETTAPPTRRVLAKQRLLGFLLSIAHRVGDVATNLIQSYIERQLGL